jgi:ATP-binding cassette subfamily F protein 3
VTVPVKAVAPVPLPVLANGIASGADSALKDKVKRLNPIKLKQMEERCAFLEEEVPRIEASIAHTEGALGNFVSADETQRLTSLLEELRGQLARSTEEWEELMLALEDQAELT